MPRQNNGENYQPNSHGRLKQELTTEDLIRIQKREKHGQLNTPQTLRTRRIQQKETAQNLRNLPRHCENLQYHKDIRSPL